MCLKVQYLLLILSSRNCKYLLFFEKNKTDVKGGKSHPEGKPFIIMFVDAYTRQQREDDLRLKSKALLKSIKHPLNFIFNLSPLIESSAYQQLYQSY